MQRGTLSFAAGSAAELSLLAIALIAGKAFGLPVLRTIHWDFSDALLGVLGIVPPLILFLWSLRSKAFWLVQHRMVVNRLVESAFGDWSILRLAIISALAGLCEEALFRALLQGGLTELLGTWPALFAAGIVFGILHRITWIYAILASLIGLYLGTLWIWTGNLLVPVLSHALYDFVALLWFLRRS